MHDPPAKTNAKQAAANTRTHTVDKFADPQTLPTLRARATSLRQFVHKPSPTKYHSLRAAALPPAAQQPLVFVVRI